MWRCRSARQHAVDGKSLHTVLSDAGVGGIVWCYMGADKENPPPLPKIDMLDRNDGELRMERSDIRDYTYLNWLENFADNGHVHVLHTLVPGIIPDGIRPYVNTTVDSEWRNSQFSAFETGFGMKTVLVQNTADPDLKFVNTLSIIFPYVTEWRTTAVCLPIGATTAAKRAGSCASSMMTISK